jgi:acetylornithine deacetylase/succinyl-diaminopimelate desuccinylase-like protein
MTGETVTAEQYLEEQRDAALDELKELCSIPSISSLPEHAGDVQRAAEWVADRLRRARLEHVRVMETGGHPVVYGDWLHAAGKVTVLVYGHFDVQPVDPIELWESDPFQPAQRDGLLFARGVSDMKSTLVASIQAIEALRRQGALPVNVKLILEGQEEIGSPQLPAFIAEHRDLLAADLVISGDGGQFSETEPALLVALKGMAGLQVNVYGANTDLHSGLYGGAVANPIHALVHILDTMHDTEGKITVEGFYDDVAPLSEKDRADMAAVPFDEEAYKRALDVPDVFGEAGYATQERRWARPTLEVNGIWGGFQGEGTKTVLPREAHAKITCRLVPNQDPARITEALIRHIKRNTLPGVRVEVETRGAGAKPYFMSPDHWGNRVAAEVLRELYGREPYITRLGGSVPVCETFQTQLGAYTVAFGFSLDDERFHAPNEFTRVQSFDRARRAWVRLLERLGTVQREETRT